MCCLFLCIGSNAEDSTIPNCKKMTSYPDFVIIPHSRHRPTKPPYVSFRWTRNSAAYRQCSVSTDRATGCASVPAMVCCRKVSLPIDIKRSCREGGMPNPLFSPVNVPPAVLQVQPTALWPSGRKLCEDRGIARVNVTADPCCGYKMPVGDYSCR